MKIAPLAVQPICLRVCVCVHTQSGEIGGKVNNGTQNHNDNCFARLIGLTLNAICPISSFILPSRSSRVRRCLCSWQTM